MRRTRHSTNTRSIKKMAELAVAAPQVIATRTARMMAAGANPDAVDRAEFLKMWTEKGQAFWESIFAMGAQMARANQEYASSAALHWMRAWTAPWWSALSTPAILGSLRIPRMPAGFPLPSAAQSQRAASWLVDAAIGPVHARATANARRLARTRTRKR
jgi:hypothetical protein